MANTQTAVPTAEELAAAQEEMRRLIFEAPIAELAEHQGISVDEAVALRVEQNLAAATIPIEVSVRPIEPQGKLIGFASVNFGGVVVDDFKVVDGKNGMFLNPPSKESNRTRSGYRAHHTGDEPGPAGAAGRPDRGRLQRGGGAACGKGRGPAPRPYPGADGAGGPGCGQGQRGAPGPGQGQGGQG